jgi:uncharacterized protein GlcG (DUF336 family)
MCRRPTRALGDIVNKGCVSAMAHGRNSRDGRRAGLVGGKIAGAIGVSGVTSDQDEQIAKAGLEGVSDRLNHVIARSRRGRRDDLVAHAKAWPT